MISPQNLFVFVVFSTFSVFLVEVKSAALVDIQQHENPQPKALLYLGNVGGKQFFVGQDQVTWENAQYECWQSGLSMVTIKTEAEYEFIKTQSRTHGAIWFGARDIGKKSMYRWSESLAAPGPNDPELDGFIGFYHYVEQGPLALVMNFNTIGGSLFGVHSHIPFAKAFCQIG